MPVNMTPKKRARAADQEAVQNKDAEAQQNSATAGPKTEAKNLDEPTEADLAEKEWKHLWDATEVIDMDTW